MFLIEQIERLITEHGCSTILRERVALLIEQFNHADRKCALLTEENGVLKLQNIELAEKARRLELENKQQKQQIRNLKNSVEHAPNPKGYRCEKCGSTKLQCTGSKPDPIFGPLGCKLALFKCLECGGESSFQENPQ